MRNLHEGANLVDLLLVALRRRRLILRGTLAAALTSAIVALCLPQIYTATAVVMPPQQDQSTTTALLGQLIGSGGAGGSGIASALGIKNPNDLYVGILRSRTIADKLIGRFKLQELYGEDTLVETREELAEHTAIAAGKDGLIKIDFEDRDPKRAAAIANAYVEELENLTASLAISDASRRRVYFEKQLDETRVALSKADTALKKVQEDTGLIRPDAQAKPIFEAVALLRAQIAAKEIALSAMRSFATERNPNYVLAQKELVGMKQQLAGFERDNKLGAGDILIPTGKVPAASLQYLEKYRDVRYYETVYELLARQFEIAKVDEGKNAVVIQLMDRAVEPDKRSKPKRVLIVLLSTLAAAMLLVLAAWILEFYQQAKLDPENTSWFAQLIRARANSR